MNVTFTKRLKKMLGPTTLIMLAAALMACQEEEAARRPGPSEPTPTLTEYGDFQCSYCAAFALLIMPEIKTEFLDTGLMRFEYKHLPILGPGSWAAANAAECAREQDAFDEYHDSLYTNAAHGTLSTDLQGLMAITEDTQLDQEDFEDCLRDQRHQATVEADRDEARRIGARGTPTLAVDGHIIEWTSYRNLKTQLNEWVEHYNSQARKGSGA